jgi:hypothetical protein
VNTTGGAAAYYDGVSIYKGALRLLQTALQAVVYKEQTVSPAALAANGGDSDERPLTTLTMMVNTHSVSVGDTGNDRYKLLL